MTKRVARNPAPAPALGIGAKDKVKNAEIRLREAVSIEEARQLLQEVAVHEVELEVQNEELRRIQLELETANARYFDLYDLAPVGYITFNEHDVILEANLTASGLLGVARGALDQQSMSRLIFHDDRDVFLRHRKRLFESNTPQTFELRLLREGLPFWARMEATSSQDASGAPVGRVVVSDITERKRVEEERRQRTLELEAANASLEQGGQQLRKLAAELTKVEERERKRLAAILHDHLQQFLVAAQMKLGLIQQSGKDEEQVHAIQEARDLLKEAITASKSLAADLHPPVLLDGGLIPGLRWLIRRMMTEHGLAVDLTGGDAIPVPEHISILLFHAVRELLINVVKHARVDRASVALEQTSEGSLRVVVKDLGGGFTQASSIEGLGLFHLRERLSHIGGTLEVVSSPGHGASICIVAPFDPAPRPSASRLPEDRFTREPINAAKPGSCRLLVVEDHAIVRQGLIELLDKERDLGVVGVATNGEQAILAARQLRPDVILMDVSMPGINGIEATRIITTEFPHARVIGLSMHEDEGIRSRMLEAGAVACYHKGDPVGELIGTIRAVSQPRP